MKKSLMRKTISILSILIFLLSTSAFAAEVRVFQNLDGSVRILRLNPRLSGATLATETAKDSSLAALPFVDVNDATLPIDRTKRDKWRLLGQKVIIDPTVPDKLHPKQALIDRANSATTVDQLKAVLADSIKGP